MTEPKRKSLLMMILDVKLTCPKCGCESQMKSFQLAEEIAELQRLAARFGSGWPWTAEYLHSFRTSLDKPLKPRVMKALMLEILEFIDKKGFNYDRKWHSIRPDALYAALRQVAMLNKTGFRNHNYLKKVAIDLNLRMIQKEDRELNEKENKLRQRMDRDPHGPERIRELIGKI
jgi:hypothetical protein